MQVGVECPIAEHRPRCSASLALAVVVVLHAQPPENRMKVVRNIPCRVHVGRAAATALVDEESVVGRDTAPPRNVVCRIDTDPHDGEVAFQHPSASSLNAHHAAVSLECDDAVVWYERDSLLTMDCRHHRSHLIAEDLRQRTCAAEHRGDIDTQLLQRSGDFASDEAHADHDGATSWYGNTLDGIAVGHSA